MWTAFPLEVCEMPDECAALIDQIIEERHRAGMTQAQLAKACGLTQSVVARIESKRARPQIDTLYKMLAALGCTLQVVRA